MGDMQINLPGNTIDRLLRVQAERVYPFLAQKFPFPQGCELYGFRLNNNATHHSTKIEYIADNFGYTPAGLQPNNIWSYGSWGDAFFVKNLAVCMQLFNGEIEYILNPLDYSLKKDGTPSDITNFTHLANVVSAIPKYYVWAFEAGPYVYCYICNMKLTNDFTCWSHINSKGDEIPYVFWSVYNAYLYNEMLRSISGVTPTTYSTLAIARSYAKAICPDKDIYSIPTYAEYMSMFWLILLLSKTPFISPSFGALPRGNYTNGQGDNQGLFAGIASGGSYRKLFGMEDLFGGVYDYVDGIGLDSSGQFMLKCTKGMQDGSLCDDYVETHNEALSKFYPSGIYTYNYSSTWVHKVKVAKNLPFFIWDSFNAVSQTHENLWHVGWMSAGASLGYAESSWSSNDQNAGPNVFLTANRDSAQNWFTQFICKPLTKVL